MRKSREKDVFTNYSKLFEKSFNDTKKETMYE